MEEDYPQKQGKEEQQVLNHQNLAEQLSKQQNDLKQEQQHALQQRKQHEVPKQHTSQPTSKKQDNRPKRKKPGFHNEMFQETSYYFKKGLRYVYPYAFTFTAHIKKRWLGLKVIELFQKEFHMESVEYYENAIDIGKIKVNDKLVTKDRVLTARDILKTTVHRHEPPVIHQDIQFLRNDDEMVVINKPSSIPVHPCGRYRHNTVVFILGKEHGLGRLHTIHRIDRLTSGILMFAKTPSKAKELEAAVKGRNVQKEYLARVCGEFPSEEEVIVDEPILTMSHKIGVCQIHPDGKPCKTSFQRLSFNGRTSVVQCKPLTGRMHQIRVHLQWLGHPIVNDPIYNHKTAWGEGNGKKGTVIDVKKVVAELIRTRKDKSYGDDDTAEELPQLNHAKRVNDDDVTNDEYPPKKSKLKLEDAPDNTKNAKSTAVNEMDLTCTNLTSECIEGVSTSTSTTNCGVSISIPSNSDSVSNSVPISNNYVSASVSESISCSTPTSQGHNISSQSTLSDSGDVGNKSACISSPTSKSNNTLSTPVRSTSEDPDDMNSTSNSKLSRHSTLENDSTEFAPVTISAPEEKRISTTVLNAVNTTVKSEIPGDKKATYYTSLDIGEEYYDDMCSECKRAWKEPEQSELVMYLHALTYKGPDWEFNTSTPEWASEHWTLD